MLVKEIMTQNVITVSPNTNIFEALALINQHRIRHLPIINDTELVGIVSDRDLRDVKPSTLESENMDFLKAIKVEQIMKTNVITAHPLDSVDEAAALLYRNRIGSLPVINGGKIVGIVTHGDLIRALVELMGVDTPGSLIVIEFLDRPGVLADVAEIMKKMDININSVFLRKVKDKPGFSTLTMRVGTMVPDGIISEIRKVGFKVLWP
ncbi:CBS and ACT domain-containing protein [Desulfitibacter alkalitolerans]|uniref:CBS and ACT domain-containing protein n=1 Tax=Desulfitibacter alkalitolerans TaxID=264641 RepID=UPI000481CF72|nr:CBS and ACT domain-containing protein [Desulfitibacter alkalitolerans]